MWYALLRAADALNESLAFDADDHSPQAWRAFRRAPSTLAERSGLKLLTSFLRKTLQSSKFAAGVTAPPDEIADVCTYATLDAVDAMLKGERCVDVVQKGVRIKCGSDLWVCRRLPYDATCAFPQDSTQIIVRLLWRRAARGGGSPGN